MLVAAFPDVGIGLLGVALAFAVGELWLFWVAPIIGAVLGALIYRYLGSTED